MPNPTFDADGVSRILRQTVQQADGPFAVFRMNQFKNPAPDEVFIGMAEDAFSGRPRVEHQAGRIDQRDGIGAVFNQRAKPPFALPHLLLRPFALGHIAGDDQHLVHFALVVLDNAALGFDVSDAAVVEQEAKFAALADARADGFLEGQLDSGDVVGMDVVEGTSAAEGLQVAQNLLVGGAVI